MTPEEIKDKYKERIEKCMNTLRATLIAMGYNVSELDFYDCDSSSWRMLLHVDDGEDVDISFTIAESEQYDGSDNGVNFMSDFVETGGHMLGGMCPYNYTDKCWVSRDDADAVEERFKLMEDAITNTDEAGLIRVLKS